MADYKRLVSYIYNYESGIRQKNVGFSRVESRNGQCKVTIHITASVSPQESMKVYLFHRDGKRIEGIHFGNISVKSGTGDFKAETNTNALMGTEYNLEDISGVIIYLNENKFFGSQWDDQEIKIENFYEYEKVKLEKDRVDRLVQDITVEPANVTDMVLEEELANQIRNPEAEDRLQAAEYEEQEAVNGAVERVVAGVKELFQEEQENEVVSTQIQQEEIDEAIPETQYQAQELEIKEDEMEEESLETTAITEEISYENVEEESEAPVVTMEMNSINENCCCSEDYPECVRRVLQSFPAVKPFPNSNTDNWVKIEPKDIGMLPVETWILANNSFLLHGYYNYRHLIFGILQVDSGTQYVIGVPGLLQSTEQTMAGMFGFHRFLATQDDDKQLNFGYWIQQIVL